MTTMFHEAFGFVYKGNEPIKQEKTKPVRRTTNRQPMPRNRSANSVLQVQKSATNITRGGSFIVGQKLRESKWFTHEETNILLAVIESGFIVEKKCEGDSVHGVALWTHGFEKSKDPEQIQICYLQETKKKRPKVILTKLMDFWEQGSLLRINNQWDRDETPHGEETVRDQIAYAENNRQNWHNSQHFAYWCRYGPPQINYRVKQVSDSVKWGNIGINTGLMLLLKKRQQKK